MRFGPVRTSEADGAILAHSVKLNEARLPKGHRLSPTDVTALIACGTLEVVVARLEPGDLMEDEAATRIAEAIAPDHLRFSQAATGRVNVYSRVAGLFVATRRTVDQLNRIDPAITLACLADHVPVQAGDMVATIKIIPLAVSAPFVEEAQNLLRDHTAFEVKPFSARRAALIATQLPTLKPQVMDKTKAILTARLRQSGSELLTERRVAHTEGAVAAAINELQADHDLLVVFGASAVADPDDVIPAAVRHAGGVVDHVGMPVDPGNLLVLGRVGATPVIGAPGCARSPRENGFDWILDRILAGEWPSFDDITGLGVGGLLGEIPTRPQPREKATALPSGQVEIVVLAAGRASRMGTDGGHKLLATFDGVPLVRRSVEAAITAAPGRVVVVTGHREADIRAALENLPAKLVSNPDYLSGMASSLTTGLSAVSDQASGILVMLADMPGVTGSDLRKLLDRFTAENGRAVIRATAEGQRGNPVILPQQTFSAVRQLVGDVGARHIIEKCGLPVIDVELGSAARLDLDTPEQIVAAGGILEE
ncbi:molybdopterin-binding/glycosyltransferase family 2 protein [Ensifer adhaerens]|uniref:NTP transferase domain-containing protein n=1 Tax=Ensifer adhaerens TaxID=106592 RepID=UPI001CBE7630|nr:molybdopterin-binding/glycosyltransferase family 2 protein [Ensifer adhaerens]MBZ7921788.1 molybdopterin-binding/glycosyltransferase family 2 protein [Ensifer adhaerens]UAX94192.1 molybdopterin-binding/glycosyltransferase family 2 protein [Ensifer adhaerens]UAY01827.1 molybdopterin-binding/glycosyltransferase family 2 protein [Ensifer adhaerens]UAY09210.1 molybdopterin-binding/glycosyltransferase family 2 protein [Ensifer adhaerens]